MTTAVAEARPVPRAPVLTWISWRRQRGSILGWSLGLLLYGLLTLTLFPSVEASADLVGGYLETLPPAMRAFVGDIQAFATPGGFLELEFLNYYILLLGIYAIIAGGMLVAGEEEQGTLDVLLALPLSRTRILAERWAALALSLVSVTVLLFLGMWAGVAIMGMDLAPAGMAVAVFGGLPGLLFLLNLTVLLSALLRHRRQAGLGATAVAVGSFLLTGLGRVSETLEPFRPLSFLTYYQAPLTQGVDWTAAAAVLAVSLVFLLGAFWAFERRDIHLG